MSSGNFGAAGRYLLVKGTVYRVLEVVGACASADGEWLLDVVFRTTSGTAPGGTLGKHNKDDSPWDHGDAVGNTAQSAGVLLGREQPGVYDIFTAERLVGE
jgi:uncharacterized spore protein YtfJ